MYIPHELGNVPSSAVQMKIQQIPIEMTLTGYFLIMSQEFKTSSKCNTSSCFCILSIITQATIESTTRDMTIVSYIEIKHQKSP